MGSIALPVRATLADRSASTVNEAPGKPVAPVIGTSRSAAAPCVVSAAPIPNRSQFDVPRPESRGPQALAPRDRRPHPTA